MLSEEHGDGEDRQGETPEIIQRDDSQINLSDTVANSEIDNHSHDSMGRNSDRGYQITNFTDFIFLLPTFSGSEDDLTIGEFLDKVNEIASLQNWNDQFYVAAIKQKLIGEAASFARLHPAIKQAVTKQQIDEELRNRFGKIDDGNNLLKLTQATQKHTENTRAFLSRLSALALRCFPHDEVVRERLLYNQALKGLNSNTRRFVMSQNAQKFGDIWQAALQEEKCMAFDRHHAEINVAAKTTATNETDSDIAQIKQLLQVNMLESDKKINELSEQVQKLTLLVNSNMQIQHPTTQTYPPQYQTHPVHFPFQPPPQVHQQYPTYNQSNNRSHIICFNCHKPGHISRNCRQTRMRSNNSQQLN